MAGKLIPDGKQQFFDNNGDPLVAGTVDFYEPGTTTLKDTYQDRDLTVLNTNPIVLDSAGRAVIWGRGLFRQVVKDSLGNTIWDQVTSGIDTEFGNAVLWGGVSTGTANAQVLTVDVLPEDVEGYLIGWIAGFTNTDEMTIEIVDGDSNTTGALSLLKGTSDGPVEMEGGEIVAGNFYVMALDSSLNAFQVVSHIPKSTSNTTVTIQKLIFHPYLDTDILDADTHDWSPTGLADYTRVKIQSSQDIDLTGITAASQTGTLLLLENWGAFNITLKSHDALSLAQNRFDYAADVILGPDENIFMIYDGGWRLYLVRTEAEVAEEPVAMGFTDITVEHFTASGTWTKPDNLVKAEIVVVASGGEGFVTAGHPDFGKVAYSGGGGGGSVKLLDAADLGATETVTISNSEGGTCSFGSHLSATGGQDGSGSGPGAGGTASDGDLNVSGTSGSYSVGSDATLSPPGGRPGITLSGRYGWGGGNPTVTPKTNSIIRVTCYLTAE